MIRSATNANSSLVTLARLGACVANALVLVAAATPVDARTADPAAVPSPATTASSDAPSAPAATPDGQTPNGTGIQDIIVTAQRRNERLQSVPIAITAFSGKSLSAIGVTDTQALQMVTPGLIMNKVLDSSAPFLRGVGSPDVTPSNEAAVATYLDGFYLISTSSGIFSLSNVDRVEVLKGPQGTLFGRNTTGGLIQIITRTPSDTLTGNIEAGYANYNTFSGRAYVSGGLGGGFSADLAMAGSDQQHGWGINQFTGKKVNYDNEITARGKLRWHDGATDVTFALLYARRRGDIGATYQTAKGSGPSQGLTTFAGTGKYNTNSDQTPQSNVDNVTPTLSINHDFGSFSLVSLTSYQDVVSTVGLDTDGSPLPIANAELHSTSKGWTQEFQLVSAPSSPIKWIAGVYGLTRRGAYNPVTITLPFGVIVTNSMQRTNSLSAFGQVTAPLGDATNLTVGLRFSHDQAKARSSQTFNGFSLGPESFAERTYNKLSYRVSLDHKLSNDVLAYASYNRGFKAGLFALINYPIAAGETKPEKIDAYEVGLKSQFFDNKVILNLSAFYYDYANIQTFFFYNNAPTVINAPKARIYGGEVEATYRPVSQLTFHAGASFLPEAKYVDFPSAPFTTADPAGGNSLVLRSVAGYRMIRTPKFSGNFSATYTVPTAIGDLDLNGVASYTGKFFWSVDDRVVENENVIFNASAKLNLHSGLSVSGWIKNISNKYVYAYALASTAGDFGVPAPPRTYGVTVGYHF